MNGVYIHPELVHKSAPLARVYYAVRKLDRPGQGWVKCTYKQLSRLTGLAADTIKRYLRRGAKEGWFQQFEPHGASCFVRYTAAHRLTKSNLRGRVSQQVLQSNATIKTKAALTTAAWLQTTAEAKLRYSILRGKRPDAPVYGEEAARRSHKAARGRERVYLRPGVYTVGVSQATIAQIIGRSRPTISRWLRPTQKVWPQQEITLRQFMEAPYPCFLRVRGRSAVPYRVLPYIYTERILPSQFKKVMPPRLRLTPDEWEQAKLLAILAGLPYSREGAIQYITKRGHKFWRELFRQRQNRQNHSPRFKLARPRTPGQSQNSKAAAHP